MHQDAEIQSQIRKVLERFNDLVSRQDLQVLGELASGDDTRLIGSDSGEVARGSQGLAAFFARVYARDSTFSWEWDRIDISYAGDLAWFFADGWVIISTAREQRKSPYRLTGVLEHHGERWLWKQYHGSEPTTSD
jgi:hypothetical protein